MGKEIIKASGLLSPLFATTKMMRQFSYREKVLFALKALIEQKLEILSGEPSEEHFQRARLVLRYTDQRACRTDAGLAAPAPKGTRRRARQLGEQRRIAEERGSSGS